MSQFYNVRKVPIIFIKKQIIDTHIERCNKLPSAGYGAIVNLLQYPITKLFIKGFTFFKDGHTMNYIGDKWKDKMVEKSNKKTISNMDDNDDLKERVIHSLVRNDFAIATPHNFNYEYGKVCDICKSDTRIVFDVSIADLYAYTI